ncbi:hypothetical protein AIOL_003405 [Candidatus Rhodobacter oscarellae]|uniref:HTH tetR-type domain-containing protein n=2 Tax=Candidatus Rhodobacter oscarellae TaxID=1675527 RepID=A0A0J9E6W3_9RHOB|nr:hypothetical protein AIOL_003405 [Candidatus Rhodobacter lobularis]
MSKIAKNADVAIGSVYNHFASKDILIRAIYQKLGDELLAELVPDDQDNLSDMERLERYIDDYISFIWKDTERAILFEYLSNVPLIPSEDLVSVFADTSQYLNDLLTRLRESGQISQDYTGVMPGFIGGAIRNALKWQRINGKQMTPELHQVIKKTCLSALRFDQVDRV